MHHAYIDKLAYQDSPIHRLDSRVKFICVLVFTAVVISLPPTSVSILACYAVGPFAILVLGRIPLRFTIRHIIIVSPFVLFLALSCPLYAKDPIVINFGSLQWPMTTGWLRCFSILSKFVVTMMALIALVSTTRFSDLLTGLAKLGVPKLLVIQLGLLYRYIFVLIDRAAHILRARSARKLRNLGFTREVKVASSMVGSLLIGGFSAAQRTSIAMQARGFDGKWRTIHTMKIRPADYLFCLLTGVFLLTLHFFIRTTF